MRAPSVLLAISSLQRLVFLEPVLLAIMEPEKMPILLLLMTTLRPPPRALHASHALPAATVVSALKINQRNASPALAAAPEMPPPKPVQHPLPLLALVLALGLEQVLELPQALEQVQVLEAVLTPPPQALALELELVPELPQAPVLEPALEPEQLRPPPKPLQPRSFKPSAALS